MQQVAGVGKPRFVDEQHTVANHQAIQETSVGKYGWRCLQPNACKKTRHARSKRAGVPRIRKNGNSVDCHKLAWQNFRLPTPLKHVGKE
jgi:hypothetical protein